MMKQNNGEILWMTYLRALATFCVIVLHVAAPILYQYGTVSNFNWHTGNIYDSLVRFSVPVFLMLTGALVLPQSLPLSEFLKRRFSRLLFPFLFWSVVYILYNPAIEWHHSQNTGIKEALTYMYYNLRDGAAYHLWYVYMIIGVYLFLPIISKWIINSSKSEVLYFIAVWFAVAVINLNFFKEIKPVFHLGYFSGFLGFTVLGYYLAFHFAYKHYKMLGLLLFVSGVVFTIVSTFYLTAKNGIFYENFYSYLSPNIIIASAGIFLIFKNSVVINNPIISFVKFISKYSYGIYLSHVFVLMLLKDSGLSFSFITPVAAIPLTSMVCLLISAGLTFCLNKIPYGRYISG